MTWKALLGGAIVLGLLLAGCDMGLSPSGGSLESNGGPGRVTLSVGLAGLSPAAQSVQSIARTVYPEDDAFNGITYVADFTANGSGTTVEGVPVTSGEAVELMPGTYTVTVTGTLDQVEIAVGTKTEVSVSSGGTTPVTVILGPKAGSGEGTFSYDITVPDGLAEGSELKITNANNEPVGSAVVLTASGNHTADITDIPAGTYRLAVTLIRGTGGNEEYAGFSEALHIYAGQTSALPTVVFEDEDFSIRVTAPVALEFAAPVPGETPDNAVEEVEGQFTGTIEWETNKLKNGKFDGSTVYTATVTLTAAEDLTFTGVGANVGFTVKEVPSATVTNTAGSGNTIVVTVEFAETAEVLSGSLAVGALQQKIDAIADGTLYIDGLAVTGAGIADFGTAKVNLIGSLTTDDNADDGIAVLNLAAADVTFATGMKVDLGHEGDLAVLSAAQLGETETIGSTGIYAEKSDDATAVGSFNGTVTAIENLVLSDATTVASSLTVYVYGTLTVDSAATGGMKGKIVALKDAAVKGSNGEADVPDKVDVSKAVISVAADQTTVSVKLPETVSAQRFSLSGNGQELTVTNTTSIEAYMDAGSGVLKLDEAVTHAKISGYGRVEFANSVAALDTGSSVSTGSEGYVKFTEGLSPAGTLELSGNVILGDGKAVTLSSDDLTLKYGTKVFVDDTDTALFSADGEVTLSGSGAVLTATVADGLEVATAAVEVTGNVSFAGDLTLNQVGATFGGLTTFDDEVKVTLKDGSSVITLGPEAVLGVQGGSILINESDATEVTLTPDSNGAVLAFGKNDRILTQGANGDKAHTVTVGGTGTLAAGASYLVESEDGKVGTLAIDSGAKLTLAVDGESASLVLTGADGTNGAILSGEGTLVAGATTVTGGASGSWQVKDSGTGTVTIKADSIAASTATAALTGTADDGAVINVTGATLTVTGIIDIATNGTVTLTGDDSGTGGSLLLKGDAQIPGQLIISGETGNDVTVKETTQLGDSNFTETTLAAVTGSDGTSKPTGVLKGKTADVSDTPDDVGSIGGGDEDAKSVLVTGSETASNALAIVKGAKVKSFGDGD
jgi:hypothetical protein